MILFTYYITNIVQQIILKFLLSHTLIFLINNTVMLQLEIYHNLTISKNYLVKAQFSFSLTKIDGILLKPSSNIFTSEKTGSIFNNLKNFFMYN